MSGAWLCRKVRHPVEGGPLKRDPRCHVSIHGPYLGTCCITIHSRHFRPSVVCKMSAISRRFERDLIPYALETDWPVGAAGFEPLHLEIRIC